MKNEKCDSLCDEAASMVIGMSLEALADLTVERLADNMQVSRFHLCRCFRRERGTTVARFLLHVKLLKSALEMQAHPDMKISQISRRMGVSDPKYFNLVFKKFFGKPPSIFHSRSN